ncbi:40S ribosomal protein S7-like [Mesocricetus auratus]|uniref:40S ribosomal protein S7 n=1 Tax=Mesocricetus auratus TaxID=10036 RepID=A0A3Q0CX76_MESAU|nr:40S ribosomal protein S7-like [Mesocricetus auratus]
MRTIEKKMAELLRSCEGLHLTVLLHLPPNHQLKSFQKNPSAAASGIGEFSGKHVVFTAQRRILPEPTQKSRTKNKQKHHRSRTLAVVHDVILEDLVFPSKLWPRILVKRDGSRLAKVHLDKTAEQHGAQVRNFFWCV